MTVQAAYRSTHPSVLDAVAANQARFDEFGERCNELAAEFPGEDRGVAVQDWSGHRHVVGLFGSKPEGPWQEGGENLWVPYRRSKAGKALEARLKELRYVWQGLPGMPSDVFDDENSRLYNCGMMTHDGVVWVTWGCPDEKVEATPRHGREAINLLVLWERAKLSAYYAAAEAHEETKAVRA